MEENNSSNTSNEGHKCKEVKIDIEEQDKLSNSLIEQYKPKKLAIDDKVRLIPALRCCIYRVPRNLRGIKEDAYTPQFISIGPFHHGKPELADMEKQKVRYKGDFGQRLGITDQQWEYLIDFIKAKEQQIRDCYEETSRLGSHEFIIMILYDAIFIIELFLKSNEENDDFLLKNARLYAGIWLDLQLMENQLPFFVLRGLFESALRVNVELTTLSLDALSREFFELSYDGEFDHFVDFRRNSYLKGLPTSKKSGQITDLPSAVKLHESGVKLEKVEGKDKCLLDINFQKGCATWIPCFKVDKLQIPQIAVDDTTECLFRNMIAFEQCHCPSQTHICNYVNLMDFQIDTEKDVGLLVEKKIISNCVGEPGAIANMFNKLCLQITPSRDSRYKEISEDLKHHCETWWNRTKATLISVYFTNLWRGTGTVVATILLVLTLLQTINSMRRMIWN